MHPENLLPLIRLLPIVFVMAATLGWYLWFERGRRKRDERRTIQREKAYWMAEMAYRGRMRVKAWLSGTKTPRLTYRGPPLTSEALDQRRAGRRK